LSDKLDFSTNVQADLTPRNLLQTYLDFLRLAITLKERHASQIQLLISLETDYITSNDLTQTIRLIDDHPEIDYVVGSVHHVQGISIDFDRTTWIRSVLACSTSTAGKVGQPRLGSNEDGTTTDTLNASGTTMILPHDGNGPPVLPPPPTLPPGQDLETFRPSSSQLRSFLHQYFDAQYQLLQTFQPEVVGHFDLCLLWTPDVSLSSGDGLDGVWEKVERNIRYIVGYGGLIEANSAAFRKGWETSYPGREVVQVSLEGRALRVHLPFVSQSLGSVRDGVAWRVYRSSARRTETQQAIKLFQLLSTTKHSSSPTQLN
jgi:histidinol-phosphatase (PHP family)